MMTAQGNPTAPPPEAGAIDSRRLQVFLAAAQTESFASAADRLSLTPSAVSHAIKTLEEEFDCNLFKRHGPRVTLTRAGMRLMPLAEELLTRLSRLRHEVAALQGNPRSLRVMMPESFSTHLLPRVLPDFMECFPMALFEPVPGDVEDEGAMQRLLAGDADLLICHGVKPGREVVRRDLYQETFAFYAAPFHTLARRHRLEVNVFEQHPLLVADAFTLRMARERLFAGDASRHRLWHTLSVESAKEMARVGLAVALLPQGAARKAVTQGTLVPLDVNSPCLQCACSLYWPAQTELSWAAEVFASLIEMAAEEDAANSAEG